MICQSQGKISRHFPDPRDRNRLRKSTLTIPEKKEERLKTEREGKVKKENEVMKTKETVGPFLEKLEDYSSVEWDAVAIPAKGR